MGSVPTRTTEELSLRKPIAFFSMPTLRTTLRGIVGIYLRIGHTIQACLVADKLPKLIEAPIATFGPVYAPDPGPQGDPGQLLNGDPLFRAFSADNQCVCN